MKLYIWRGVPGKRTPAAFLRSGANRKSPHGLDADENPNLLGLGERRMKFVEAADKKVADETIEKACVVAEQDAETVVQALA